MADESKQELMNQLNRIVASMMPREPNYLYWQHGSRRFCWTTERAECKGKMRFVAFIRKELVSKRRKNTRTFKLVKQVGFARRKVAKARAWMWYESWRKKKSSEKISY
jgi:hypothetical protein